MDRIVEENVRPAGAGLESYATSGDAIPSRLLAPSRIIMQDRNDGSGRQYRNEVGDLVLMNPTTGDLYVQRKVRLNWHEDRDGVQSDLPSSIPGLDVNAETGEVLDVDALRALIKAARKAGASGVNTAAAVVED